LENFSDDVDMNGAWESIRENVRALPKKILDHYELKHCKPWLDERSK